MSRFSNHVSREDWFNIITKRVEEMKCNDNFDYEAVNSTETIIHIIGYI